MDKVKVRFEVPFISGNTRIIEGELTPEETESLLEFAFMALLSRGISPASLSASVNEALDAEGLLQEGSPEPQPLDEYLNAEKKSSLH